MTIRHSLIVPTRNRPEYVAVPVGFYLRSSREDVEVIVCDASDDSRPVQAALLPYAGDDRLHLIDNTVASTGRVSSMVENWSRALDAAHGRWITIIGDDDVCDPAVVDFLESVEKITPTVPAVTWHRAHFDVGIEISRPAKIPMGIRLMLAVGAESLIKQISWPDPKKPPTAMCSPYHGAVRREMLEGLRAERGGGWFRFRIPDYDLGWSIARMADRFLISERPFSITGVSPKSNSYSVRSHDARVSCMSQWLAESKEVDGWGMINDTFFATLPMTVLGFRNAFVAAYGLNTPINLENLIKTLMWSCQVQGDDDSFERHREGLVRFLNQQFGQDFGASHITRLEIPAVPVSGLVGGKLMFSNQLVGGDLLRFAEFVFGIVAPVRHLFSSSKAAGLA